MPVSLASDAAPTSRGRGTDVSSFFASWASVDLGRRHPDAVGGDHNSRPDPPLHEAKILRVTRAGCHVVDVTIGVP